MFRKLVKKTARLRCQATRPKHCLCRRATILVVVEFGSWDGNRFHTRAAQRGEVTLRSFRLPETCSTLRRATRSRSLSAMSANSSQEAGAESGAWLPVRIVHPLVPV